jgi:hypothetical protein
MCSEAVLSLATMYLRRVRAVADGFAAGAPPPTIVLTVVTPPAPAAKYLGAGLQRPYRGQTCGGMVNDIIFCVIRARDIFFLKGVPWKDAAHFVASQSHHRIFSLT